MRQRAPARGVPAITTAKRNASQSPPDSYHPGRKRRGHYTLRMRTQTVTPQEHTDAAERTHSERGHVRTFSANSSRNVSTLWKPRSTKSPRNR